METIVEACRLCAKLYANPKELEFVHLFEPYKGLEHEVQFILDQLKAWHVEVHAGDGLPQRICANCFDSFCNIDVFKQECLNAQQNLLQYYIEANANDLKAVAVENQAQYGENMESETPATSQFNANMEFTLTPEQQNTIVPNQFNMENTSTELNLVNTIDVQNNLNTFEYNNNMKTEQSSSTMLPNNEDTLENLHLMSSIPPNDVYFQQTVSLEAIQQKSEDSLTSNPEANVNEMENIAEQDLEDMLQSNVIPKNVQQTTVHKDKAVESVGSVKRRKRNKSLNVTSLPETNVPKFQLSNTFNINYEDATDANVVAGDMENSPKTLVSGIPLACQYCYCHSSEHISQLIYPDADALSQHYFDVHDPNLPYNCPYCTEAFKSPKPRDYHVSEVHRSVLPATECEYCHKVIRTTNEMHQYSCNYVSDWHCNVCDEHFPNMPLSRYRAHQRKHNATKQHRCRHCGREFVRRANLETHERMHRVEHIVMVKCTSCKATFKSEYELKRHKYQVHSGEMPVKCEYCSKGFASIAFLNRHMNHLHSDKLNDPKLDNATTCNNCGHVFNSVLKLRYHLQRPRDENGNCTLSATDLLNEEKKEKRRSRMQGLFPCSHCSKRFYMKSQLEKHLKTHDASLRPHQCNHCHIRCRTSYELQEHVNVAHLSLKAHECNTCGKRFGYKKDLYNHELFHAELKVHCKETGCDFICRSDKALNDHIRQKHRLIPCEYCGTTFTRQRLLAHLHNVHSDEIENDIAGMGLANSTVDDSIVNKTEHPNNNNNSENNDEHNTTDNVGTNNTFLTSNMEADQYFVGTIMDLEHENIVK